MTSGSPGRLIILFAIPLMLGNICPTALYNGGYYGRWPDAQVWRPLLHWVRLTFCCGLSQEYPLVSLKGFSIQLAPSIMVQKDFENLRKSLATELSADRIHRSGVFILSQSFAALVLTGLHTLPILSECHYYICVLFSGIPATAAIICLLLFKGYGKQ